MKRKPFPRNIKVEEMSIPADTQISVQKNKKYKKRAIKIL
jgi:hypothetical protein